MTRAALMGALCLLLAGCGSDGDDGGGGSTTIASGKLAGKVGGMNWTLATAQTNANLSDDTEFWVDLYSSAPPAGCGSTAPGHNVILTVPNKVGSHNLGLQLNGTFVIDNANQDNLVGTQGTIRVDEITDTMIRGGVSMTYDAANSINGEFEATICK